MSDHFLTLKALLSLLPTNLLPVHLEIHIGFERKLLHVKDRYRMLEQISIYTYIEANCDDKRPISRQQNLLLYAIFRTN